jgi:hypothetical protein
MRVAPWSRNSDKHCLTKPWPQEADVLILAVGGIEAAN